MARQNTNAEVFKQITEVGLLRDSDDSDAGSTTLSASAAAGATTISVTSETGFAADDLIRIGSGDQIEENVVLSASAGSITLKMPLAYAHASGVAVVERMRVEIAAPTEDGVILRSNAELTDILTATSFRPFLRLLTGSSYEFEFSVRTFNLENLATGLGIPESNITGLGTTASPSRLVALDTLLASESNLSLYATGVRQDGTTFEFQGWGVDMNPTQELNLRSGEGTPIRMSGQAKTIAVCSPALP